MKEKKMGFKFVEPKVEFIGVSNMVNDVDCMKRIEYCGRNCYQTAHKITTDSFVDFYKMLINRGHESVFEHASFTISLNKLEIDEITNVIKKIEISNLRFFVFEYNQKKQITHITGSVRSWRDLFRKINDTKQEYLNWFFNITCYKFFNVKELFFDFTKLYEIIVNSFQREDIKKLEQIYPKYNNPHKLITFEWICDRGVSHEEVRHRMKAFSQESTRFCSYNSRGEETKYMYFINPFDYETLPNKNKITKENFEKGQNIFNETLENITKCYNELKDLGFSNDTARAILPNTLKTNIIFSCYETYLPHFFNLRTAKTAHYQIRQLAQATLEIYEKN
jgi:thymidylate synthase (FAD)